MLLPFVRYRKAGVWHRLTNAITFAHEGEHPNDTTSRPRLAKRGCRSLSRPITRWPHVQDPRRCRRARPPGSAIGWPTARRADRRHAARPSCFAYRPNGRQGLRPRSHPEAELGQGATLNIPPESNRPWKPCFSKRTLPRARPHRDAQSAHSIAVKRRLMKAPSKALMKVPPAFIASGPLDRKHVADPRGNAKRESASASGRHRSSLADDLCSAVQKFL
jgi:hypothetical protein